MLEAVYCNMAHHLNIVAEVASDCGISPQELKSLPCGQVKHEKLDDMTVVVVFIDDSHKHKRQPTNDEKLHKRQKV